MGGITHASVGTDLSQAEWEATTTHTIGGVASLNVVRSASLVVAANNALAASKAQADYVCDGTADQTDINLAVTALGATGGTVQLSEGTFSVTGAINLASYVTLQGMGKATSITTATPAINVIAAIGTQGSPLVNVKVADLYMWGNDAASDAIHYEWAHRSYIKGVEVSGFQGSGIYMLCCFFPTVNDIYVTASGKLSTTKPAVHLASNADDSTNEGSIYNIAITSCYYTPLKIDGGTHPCNTMYICGLQIEQMGASQDVANCVDLNGDNNHIIGATISSAGTTKVGLANTGYGNSISQGGFFQPMGTMITSTGSDLMVSDISGYGGTFVNGINLIAGADHCTLKGIHLNGAFSGYGIQVASDDNILDDLELDATFGGESISFISGADNNLLGVNRLSKALSNAGTGNTKVSMVAM